MRCSDVQELLPFLSEGGLSAEDLDRVRGHLEGCPACRGLSERLKRTGEALSGFLELEPGPALMARLRGIPSLKEKRRRVQAFALKPSLQPVLAGAFMVLAFAATMVFTPVGGKLLKTIDRQVHSGYSQLEKLYARAESVADSLGGAKDEIIGSIKTLPPLSRDRE